MLPANFKLKKTAVASRGFLAVARLFVFNYNDYGYDSSIFFAVVYSEGVLESTNPRVNVRKFSSTKIKTCKVMAAFLLLG